MHFIYSNSAGVVIDAIRCVKIALDRNQGGVVHTSGLINNDFFFTFTVKFPASPETSSSLGTFYQVEPLLHR